MTKVEEEVSPQVLERTEKKISTILSLFGEALQEAAESVASWNRLEECLRHYKEMEELYRKSHK